MSIKPNAVRLTVVLALLPVVASAQQGDPPPSASANPPSTADGDLQEVVVSGIRSSIQQAQEIKRESAVLVEAITLEDLGK